MSIPWIGIVAGLVTPSGVETLGATPRVASVGRAIGRVDARKLLDTILARIPSPVGQRGMPVRDRRRRVFRDRSAPVSGSSERVPQ